MIERSTPIKIYNEVLGAKGAKARMIRVAPEGHYEVSLESGGHAYTAWLPIQSTVILAAEPDVEVSAMEVER